MDREYQFGREMVGSPPVNLRLSSLKGAYFAFSDGFFLQFFSLSFSFFNNYLTPLITGQISDGGCFSVSIFTSILGTEEVRKCGFLGETMDLISFFKPFFVGNSFLPLGLLRGIFTEHVNHHI